MRNGTWEVKGKNALNIGGNSKNQTAGEDSSPAFKYSKFQTTSTDPIFITHTRTNEAFLEGKTEKKIIRDFLIIKDIFIAGVANDHTRKKMIFFKKMEYFGSCIKYIFLSIPS